MDGGRAILGNFTSSVGNLTGDVPEVQQFMTGLEELGYTSQIIAFLILFAIFMIFFHLTRIVASADSASVNVPLVGGINVGNPGTGGQLLNEDELGVLQNCPMQLQPRMLQGPDGPPVIDGGGKKRRKRKTRKRRKTKRRKRKTKRKTKKRKRHRRKKKKSTRKR